MNTKNKRSIPFWAWGIIAFVFYLFSAIAFTWPLVLDMNGHILGYIGFENTAQTLWIFHAWRTYQLDVLHDFITQYGYLGFITNFGELYHMVMCFPERNSVSNGLDFFWTWPLAELFGFPNYYNIKCLLILALDGLSAYILARHFTERKISALVAGFFYAFNPYHFYLLITGRIIESQTFLPILAIYALIKIWDKDSAWRWSVAGAILGLVTDNYWFYGHFTIVFIFVYLIYQLCTRNYPKLGPCWRNLVFYLLTFLIVILPFAHPYLIRAAIGQRIPGMVRPDPSNSQSMTSLTRQMIAFSAEADYPIKQQTANVRSPYTSPWWGAWQCTFLANALFVGLIPALLMRRKSFWVIGAFVFYLLPLGPFLKYQGTLLEIQGEAVPMPYLYLIQYYPLIAKLFWPNQSMFLFAISLSILIGMNLDRFLNFKFARRNSLLRIALILLVVMLPFVEMQTRQQLPLPQDKLTIPSLYQSEGRGQGYIFVPLGRRYWERLGDFNRDYYHGADVTIIDLHLAMSNGRGMFGRPHYMAHKDYWLYNPYNLTTHPYLRWLVALGVRPSPEFSEFDQQQLLDEGYKYLVVHERICSHINLEQSNRTDIEGGKKIFDTICAELKEKYGEPVYKGQETSWDQNLIDYRIVPHTFRINIYEITPSTLKKGGK